MTELPRARILLATPPFSHERVAIGPMLTTPGVANLRADLEKAGYRDILEVPHTTAAQWRRDLVNEPRPT